MPRRARGLLVLALALVVMGGLVVADVVTLSKAKPSFDHETRAFQRFLQSQSTSTTVSPKPSHHTGASTTSSTTTTGTSTSSSSSTNSSTTTTLAP